MKLTKLIVGSAACAAVVFALGNSTTQAQNLITDPSFENQTAAPNPNPTGVPGWSTFNGAAFSQTVAHTGSWSMLTPGGGGGFSVPGAFENFAASAGESFTLSGWVFTPNTLTAGENDFAILQLSWYTGAPPSNYGVGGNGTAGVDIGAPAGTPPPGTVPLPPGVWTFASVTATAPAGTQSLGAFLLDINADANATFNFDDITLTATPAPEPSTLALVGMALGIPFYFLRRRTA